MTNRYAAAVEVPLTGPAIIGICLLGAVTLAYLTLRGVTSVRFLA